MIQLQFLINEVSSAPAPSHNPLPLLVLESSPAHNSLPLPCQSSHAHSLLLPLRMESGPAHDTLPLLQLATSSTLRPVTKRKGILGVLMVHLISRG